MYASDFPLCTAQEIFIQENSAFSAGLDSYKAMEQAGRKVADFLIAHYEKQPVRILLGPGNNGGDGLVVTRLLMEKGWSVFPCFALDFTPYTDSARKAWQAYQNRSEAKAIPSYQVDNGTGISRDPGGIALDALFGIGQARRLADPLKKTLEQFMARAEHKIALDMPSGICSDSGRDLGCPYQADHTVTFIAAKRGQLLLPGRLHCGTIHVQDIGITPPSTPISYTHPDLCRALWRKPTPYDHKYSRGAGLIWAGRHMTGAAILAGSAARRAGTGLLRMMIPPNTKLIYAPSLPGALCQPRENWPQALAEKKTTAALIGCGAGPDEELYRALQALLTAKIPAVIDGDGLRCLAENADLYAGLHQDIILTPHGGEFSVLFPKIAETSQDKIVKTLTAAQESGAVILYKGYDSVIAAPDGRVVVNSITHPALATAGSGDVLAGLCLGYLSQKLSAFDAAILACYAHGWCGQNLGYGLIAEDIPPNMRNFYQDLHAKEGKTAIDQ